MVVVVVTVIRTVVVVVAMVFLGAVAVVAMDTVVATDQLLQQQHIMAAQPMAPTAEGMDMVALHMVVLLAMVQAMALHMVGPCMELHTAPTGHMVVPMEVVHMVLREGMVREGMVATVGLEAWVVVAALVVGVPADTTRMESDHQFIAVL